MSKKFRFEDVVLITGPNTFVTFDAEGNEELECEVFSDPSSPPESEGMAWHSVLGRYVSANAIDRRFLAQASEVG
ncbi:MAG: hypothetical protein K6F50_02630 [Kiritimatiellae bacterium]|nr:hypothetical protein [Kiritimatiellia bacterium]